MAKLSAAARKQIPKKDFAVPSKAPASGSYPIENRSHAQNALARSSGKPVEGQVRAAVNAKYPGLAQGGQGMAMGGLVGPPRGLARLVPRPAVRPPMPMPMRPMA
jgi:hypothetical protein